MVAADAPVALTVVPDRRGTLASGALLRATIRARLLGLRLLRLEAAVVLVPADLSSAPAGLPPAQKKPGAVSLMTLPLAAGQDPQAVPSAPTRLYEPISSVSAYFPGRSLAEAMRHIQESDELLAATRRTAP